jgi:hypothetical protein
MQGLEEGHTRPCWPIQTPGVGAHRSARRDDNAEAGAGKRWDLLGRRRCSSSLRSPPCLLCPPARSGSVLHQALPAAPAGNAVTVPVARWLGERLAHPYQVGAAPGLAAQQAAASQQAASCRRPLAPAPCGPAPAWLVAAVPCSTSTTAWAPRTARWTTCSTRARRQRQPCPRGQPAAAGAAAAAPLGPLPLAGWLLCLGCQAWRARSSRATHLPARPPTDPPPPPRP